MLDRKEPRLCVVILTALPVEYQAVRAYLADLDEEVHPQGNVYEYGTFAAGGRTWKVALVEAGAGNTGASRETERAITHFKPLLTLFVGVAGGVKDVQIGDVVAVTKAYGYESGKVHDTGFLARPEVGMSSFRMIERAKAEARKQAWLQRIIGYPHGSVPTVRAFVGPIAAGEKVLASTHSELFQFLQTHYNDTLAVEMEGRGFLEAAHANEQVQALIIRGISDLLDNKSTYDAQGSQEMAANHAAAFAFEVLAHLDNESKNQPVRKEETTLGPKGFEGAPKQVHTTIGSIGIGGVGDHHTYNIHGPNIYRQPDTTQIRQQIDEARREMFGEAKQITSSTPVEIYFSYTREDENLVKQLQNQLAFLQQQNLITDWNRSKVTPGQVVDTEVTKHLNTAPIILLFISPDYMASDECNQEMNRALEREDAIVIPIFLHPVAGLKNAPFHHLQRFPRDGRAISQWGNRKESALAEIADEISTLIKEIE